ncbi:MAG: glycosyltransferase [Kofleriaceae bacterium]|nr:glycosyltransferase [Kofleriaceae bacterium]MCL4228191.1 glycosyltransferase [Myxococcales bacterium]
MTPPRLRVDVVVPARDDEAGLASALATFASREVRAVVVVDRASADGTAGVARDRGAIVLREPSGGYGAACLRALAHFAELPEPPDVVVFAPADVRLRAADVGALVGPIADKDAELTIGVPAAAGALRERVVLGLIEAVYRHRFRAAGPVRAIRYPALVALGMSDRGDGWDVEMLVRGLKLGLGMLEVAVGDDAAPATAGRAGLRAAAAAGGRSLFHILRHATVR